MRHVPFKRLLMVLVPCVLIFGIMLPLTAFAASNHQTIPVTKTTFVVTNRCIVSPAEGPQTIVTLNKGQEIEGSAVMTGNDADHEEEALALYELNGPSAILVKANFGPRNFEFTASRNGLQVVVCYTQIGSDDDSDFNVPMATFDAAHPASVTYEVEQANIPEASNSSDSQ